MVNNRLFAITFPEPNFGTQFRLDQPWNPSFFFLFFFFFPLLFNQWPPGRKTGKGSEIKKRTFQPKSLSASCIWFTGRGYQHHLLLAVCKLYAQWFVIAIWRKLGIYPCINPSTAIWNGQYRTNACSLSTATQEPRPVGEGGGEVSAPLKTNVSGSLYPVWYC